MVDAMDEDIGRSLLGERGLKYLRLRNVLDSDVAPYLGSVE